MIIIYYLNYKREKNSFVKYQCSVNTLVFPFLFVGFSINEQGKDISKIDFLKSPITYINFGISIIMFMNTFYLKYVLNTMSNTTHVRCTTRSQCSFWCVYGMTIQKMVYRRYRKYFKFIFIQNIVQRFFFECERSEECIDLCFLFVLFFNNNIYLLRK